MRETDILSVHMTRELGARSGQVTEDTARWSSLILFRDIPYVAKLSAYGRSDRRVPTGTVRLTLDPVRAFTDQAANNIIIDILEHADKAVHIARVVGPNSQGTEQQPLPVHWNFTRVMNEPGPISAEDIDRVHHKNSHPEHDEEELAMFLELSQTLRTAEK